MILASVAAIEMKDLLSAVISIGATGLALSVCFLLVKAPDLAIVQLVVEILVLIILVRGTMNREDDGSIKRERLTYVALGIFAIVFLMSAYYVICELPKLGHPLMKISKMYLAEGFQKTGSANAVVSVLLDYRAYDALAGTTVFFAAVIGVLTIMRKAGKKK